MKFLGLGLLATVCFASYAFAHHSFARYDFDKEVVLKGTVKEFQFTNPHSWVHFLVPREAGEPELWHIEGGAVSALNRVGWKRNTIKPGDTITISFHPARDASNEGSLVELKEVNGMPFLGISVKGGDGG